MSASDHCTLGWVCYTCQNFKLLILFCNYIYIFSLVSRDGYVVVDDTGYPQFDDSEWPWFTQPNTNNANSCSEFSRTLVGSSLLFSPFTVLVV